MDVLKVLKFFHNLLIVACIAITPCLFLDLLLISSIDFFAPNLCMFLVLCLLWLIIL